MIRPKLSYRLAFLVGAVSTGLILGGYVLGRYHEVTRRLDRLVSDALSERLDRAVSIGSVSYRNGRVTLGNVRIADDMQFGHPATKLPREFVDRA